MPSIFEYLYSNFKKTLLVANIIRFTKEDKYKFLFVVYVSFTIYGFNLCVKVEQKAAMNIVKDTTDFTVEGGKLARRFLLGFTVMTIGLMMSPLTPGPTQLVVTMSQLMMQILKW